jgi:glycosyltransferase involved in cell wall biosynthesis
VSAVLARDGTDAVVQPVVSVVMPVLDAARFLPAAVDSVLRQTLSAFEFLIFDDGSSDGSKEMLRRYAATDARIRLFLREHRGYVTWLNEGIAGAHGEFIARMDADDVCLPRRFESQVAFLREHGDHVAIGTSYVSIDADGEPLLVHHQETSPDEVGRRLRRGQLGVIAHPTCMMRRDAVARVGGYQERFETTEDLDLWLRLLEHGRLANVSDVLLEYRHHHSNITYGAAARQRERIGAVIAAHRELTPATRPWEAAIPDEAGRHRLWARWALASGNRRAARKHAMRALRLGGSTVADGALVAASLVPSRLVRLGLRLIGRPVPTLIRPV